MTKINGRNSGNQKRSTSKPKTNPLRDPKRRKAAVKRDATLAAIVSKASDLNERQSRLPALLSAPNFDADALTAKIDSLQKKFSAPAIRQSAAAYLKAMETAYAIYWLWCHAAGCRKREVLDALSSRRLVSTLGGEWEVRRNKPLPNSNPATIILRNAIAYTDSKAGIQMASRDGIAFKYLVQQEIKPAKLLVLGRKRGEGLEVWCRRYRQPSSSTRGPTQAELDKEGLSEPRAKPLTWRVAEGVELDFNASVAILYHDEESNEVEIQGVRYLMRKRLSPAQATRVLSAARRKLFPKRPASES